MQIIKPVFIVLEVLLLFNLLIGVHELGHFLAARWRGLKVDRFAIWFGKPIWKKKINGVEYALGWIPAGGYVALPQMATMEVIEGKARRAPTSRCRMFPPLDKIIVAFAGPLFSFVLAIVFAVIVWGVGKPDQRSRQFHDDRLGGPDRSGVESGLASGRHDSGNGRPSGDSNSAPPAQDSVTWRIVTSDRHEHRHQICPRRQGRHGLCRALSIADQMV